MEKTGIQITVYNTLDTLPENPWRQRTEWLEYDLAVKWFAVEARCGDACDPASRPGQRVVRVRCVHDGAVPSAGHCCRHVFGGAAASGSVLAGEPADRINQPEQRAIRTAACPNRLPGYR